MCAIHKCSIALTSNKIFKHKNYRENRYVLRFFLSMSSVGCSLILSGRLFQNLAAEILKRLSPIDKKLRGMVSKLLFDIERSVRVGV